MKILLGWELGAGQGHIQRLMQLAQMLAAHGHTPVFALKSYKLKGQAFPWESVLAPRLPFSGRETSHSFADILANFGFDNPALLRQHLQAWQEILSSVNPGLVIADHAPGLVLAARQKVPTVVVGSHFAVPPPIAEFPILRFPAPPESFDRQRQVSETVYQVVKLDAPLGKILNGDRHFIFSIPALDCYRVWRQNSEYVGIQDAPLTVNHTMDGSPWAYLTAEYPYRDLVIHTLNPSCEFKPLNEALANASLAIHHGGLTTSIGCLLAGIPQLLLPRHLEQQLTAYSLQSLGVAEMVTSPTWEGLVMTQAQLYNLTEHARNLAKSLNSWNKNLVETVITACLSLCL